jgi:hypothetical protein
VKFKSHKPSHRQAGHGVGIFVGLVIAAMFSYMSPYSYAEGGLSAQEEGKRWEDIAEIRLRAARGHDLNAEIKREHALREKSANSPSTAGDFLDSAGDEKYLAYENYQMARRHWERAAQA